MNGADIGLLIPFAGIVGDDGVSRTLPRVGANLSEALPFGEGSNGDVGESKTLPRAGAYLFGVELRSSEPFAIGSCGDCGESRTRPKAGANFEDEVGVVGAGFSAFCESGKTWTGRPEETLTEGVTRGGWING